MAPEQKNNRGNIDKRADIYSVGVVLFELLTLRSTISLKLPSDINKKLPKDIDNILRKALEEKPEDRYGNVEELSEALKELLSKEREISEKRLNEERASQQKIAFSLKKGTNIALSIMLFQIVVLGLGAHYVIDSFLGFVGLSYFASMAALAIPILLLPLILYLRWVERIEDRMYLYDEDLFLKNGKNFKSLNYNIEHPHILNLTKKGRFEDVLNSFMLEQSECYADIKKMVAKYLNMGRPA